MFIFNSELLLIDIGSVAHLLVVIVTAIAAMLIFAAATQGWFLAKSRWYESIALLLVTFTLLRPAFWIDLFQDRYDVVPATSFMQRVADAPVDSSLRLRIDGTSAEGKDVRKAVLLPLGPKAPASQRLAKEGLAVIATTQGVQVLSVALRSPAAKAGFEQGFAITGIDVERDRVAKEWLYVPALVLLGIVVALQRRRPPSGALAAPTLGTS